MISAVDLWAGRVHVIGSDVSRLVTPTFCGFVASPPLLALPNNRRPAFSPRRVFNFTTIRLLRSPFGPLAALSRVGTPFARASPRLQPTLHLLQQKRNMIDINLIRDPEQLKVVIESQRKRGAPPELVETVKKMDEDWRKGGVRLFNFVFWVLWTEEPWNRHGANPNRIERML